MSEMVEKVARAVECERWMIAMDQVRGMSISSMEGSRRTARAAIEALRDPTEPMLRAYYEAKRSPRDAPAGGFTRWATWEEARACEGFLEKMRACHRAMIDAALSELEGAK